MIKDCKVVYEDEFLAVLDKPSGLVVNTSETTKSQTLEDFLRETLFVDWKDKTSDFYMRAGIVHRLDKGTSGLLVISKDEKTFAALQKQFKDRVIDKEYLALVYGDLKDERVVINAAIARNLKNRLKQSVDPQGKEALTEFEKIKTFTIGAETFTLIKAFPKTGRTHQIRVHLAALGHPVVGDPVYASQNMRKKSESWYKRLMLHAVSLEFIHPVSGKSIKLTSKVPSEFEKTLE